MQLQNLERDFKSGNMFPRRSFATNLVTSLKFNPMRNATLLCYFDQTRNVSVVTVSLFSAALRQVVLQATTCSFRNALAKMGNQLLETRNKLETSLVPLQKCT